MSLNTYFLAKSSVADLHGVPITVDGDKGALAGLNLLAFWQTGNVMHHLCTSLVIPSYVNDFCIAALVFLIKKWPPNLLYHFTPRDCNIGMSWTFYWLLHFVPFEPCLALPLENLINLSHFSVKR